jgi:hypothetical protein
MFMRNLVILCLGLLLITACNSNTADERKVNEINPPADGFNAADSDEKAILLADKTMEAMGGRENWDNTRYIHWNFFGSRKLLWDKQEKRVRVESLRDSSIYLIDLKSGSGQVKRNGEILTHPDSIALYAKRGEGMWINDSYWLVMPFKLKDSGVTLKHVGQDTTEAGKMADVLQLTFKEVGNTPNNKYLVYIDSESNLVTQWDFYTNATDEQARFVTPWADYKEYGKILLSGNRGQRGLTEIAVYEEVPETAFTSFDPVDLGD